MKTKVEGSKYLITDDEGRYPYKLSKKKVDKAIEGLKKDLSHFNKTIKDLYETDYEAYRLIVDHLEWFDEFDEGRAYRLSALETNLEDLQNTLSEDDEIPVYETVILLEDFGYEHTPWGPEGRWVKKLEDTEEKLVEEEIWPETKLRRTLTIIWERVNDDFGCHKSSKEIIYKKLKMSKKLEKACENTLKRKEVSSI